MKQTRIANRYAKALFDLALEQDILESVKPDMDLVASVCEQNKDFRLMLHSPIIYTDKKEKIISLIFEKHFQQISLYFLHLITRKNREAFIEPIAKQFIEQYKEYKNITTAVLSTAVKIDQNINEEVVELLEDQTKGEIELIESVKEELIGGFVLAYKDFQYNASVQKQIKELKKEFDTNLYIREF
ncbi:MAG: ATP synthase F1 subunit delta [Bacteroidetes bacterium]|nr:ATP synthase F1 subunit delta [Bacteroidota bacterium]